MINKRIILIFISIVYWSAFFPFVAFGDFDRGGRWIRALETSLLAKRGVWTEYSKPSRFAIVSDGLFITGYSRQQLERAQLKTKSVMLASEGYEVTNFDRKNIFRSDENLMSIISGVTPRGSYNQNKCSIPKTSLQKLVCQTKTVLLLFNDVKPFLDIRYFIWLALHEGFHVHHQLMFGEANSLSDAQIGRFRKFDLSIFANGVYYERLFNREKLFDECSEIKPWKDQLKSELYYWERILNSYNTLNDVEVRWILKQIVSGRQRKINSTYKQCWNSISEWERIEGLASFIADEALINAGYYDLEDIISRDLSFLKRGLSKKGKLGFNDFFYLTGAWLPRLINNFKLKHTWSEWKQEINLGRTPFEIIRIAIK